jgi:hypothetical protein
LNDQYYYYALASTSSSSSSGSSSSSSSGHGKGKSHHGNNHSHTNIHGPATAHHNNRHAATEAAVHHTPVSGLSHPAAGIIAASAGRNIAAHPHHPHNVTNHLTQHHHHDTNTTHHHQHHESLAERHIDQTLHNDISRVESEAITHNRELAQSQHNPIHHTINHIAPITTQPQHHHTLPTPTQHRTQVPVTHHLTKAQQADMNRQNQTTQHNFDPSTANPKEHNILSNFPTTNPNTFGRHFLPGQIEASNIMGTRSDDASLQANQHTMLSDPHSLLNSNPSRTPLFNVGPMASRPNQINDARHPEQVEGYVPNMLNSLPLHGPEHDSMGPSTPTRTNTMNMPGMNNNNTVHVTTQHNPIHVTHTIAPDSNDDAIGFSHLATSSDDHDMFIDIGLIGIGALLILPELGLKAIPESYHTIAWAASLASLVIGITGSNKAFAASGGSGSGSGSGSSGGSGSGGKGHASSSSSSSSSSSGGHGGKGGGKGGKGKSGKSSHPGISHAQSQAHHNAPAAHHPAQHHNTTQAHHNAPLAHHPIHNITHPTQHQHHNVHQTTTHHHHHVDPPLQTQQTKQQHEYNFKPSEMFRDQGYHITKNFVGSKFGPNPTVTVVQSKDGQLGYSWGPAPPGFSYTSGPLMITDPIYHKGDV